MTAIGENIKHIRLEKKMTQKELGAKLGGISQQQIGQWETGKAKPKIETIKKIADALEVNYTRLIIETPFSSGSREERSKMNDEELADYLTYLTTDDDTKKQEILAQVKKRKELQPQTGNIPFDISGYTEEELTEIKEFATFIKGIEKHNSELNHDNKERHKLLIHYYDTLQRTGRDALLEILSSLRILNKQGQLEAVKRVEELTAIPRYTTKIFNKDTFTVE